MMKRLVKILFFLSLVLIAAGLVAPNFIDWNKHKDKITAALDPYVARKIEIAGNVGFRLIPQPHLLLEDVTVENLLTLKRLEAKVRFSPLLQGRFEVENIAVDSPSLTLEKTATGANWSGVLKDRQPPKSSRVITAASIQLEKVTVTNGTIHYINRETGFERVADNLNLSITADTLLGPYRIAGDMKYEGAAVNLDLGTGAYDGTAAMPVKLSFLPADGTLLPQVQFGGALDLASGFDAHGDLEIRQGSVAALLGNDDLSHLAFLKQPADLTAELDSKGPETRLKDIKATFGEGTMTGNIGVLFAHGQPPVVAADLEGQNLVIANTAYADLSQSFDASVKFKGKNISWNGTKILSVEFSGDAGRKDWAIKALRLQMPGKSDIRLAGVVSPKTSMLSIQMDTEDFPQLIAGLDDKNALKLLDGSIKKLKFSSSLDLKPENIAFSDISAVADDKVKIAGALDVARTTPRPAFAAKLKLDGFDPATVGLEKLLKSDGEIDVTIDNYTKGDFKARSVRIAAHLDDKGMALKEVTGVISDEEGFDLSGTVSPAGAFNLEYGVKTADAAPLANAFSIPLPPPLHNWKGVNLHGTATGMAAKYDFTAKGRTGGAEVDIKGAFDGAYKTALHFSRPAGGEILSLMGLPVEKLLVAQNGAFDFGGDLNGTSEDYKIENIKSQLGDAALSGTITRKDGKAGADLTVAKIDFDEWLWNDWAVKEGMDLTLRGKTLVWRDTVINDAVLQMQAAPATISIPKVTGTLWGGTVDAAVSATRKDDAWTGTLKGTVKDADLDNLRELLEIKGLSLGKGDITLDLTSTGGKFLDFTGLSGTLTLHADKLSVDAFNPAALAPVLSQLNAAPANLQQLVNNALKEKGEGVYENVDIPLAIADGKVSFRNLKLKGEGHEAEVSATLDLSPNTYDLGAIIRIKGVPDIAVQRTDDLKKTGTYGVDIGAVEKWLNKKSLPKPAAPDSPMKGVIDRLGEDTAPAQTP